MYVPPGHSGVTSWFRNMLQEKEKITDARVFGMSTIFTTLKAQRVKEYLNGLNLILRYFFKTVNECLWPQMGRVDYRPFFWDSSYIR